MIEPWSTDDTTSILRSPIFEICKISRSHPDDGRQGEFFAMLAPDWVNIVAMTPEGDIVLVRQYRHGTDSITLEIPGGMIDADEQPVDCAARELREETGYVADRWIKIGAVEPNPAFMNNTCYTYLGLGATLQAEQEPDEHEELEVVLVPRREFDRLIHAGQITHALVVAAAFHLRGWEDQQLEP